jgi:hypothetical protein
VLSQSSQQYQQSPVRLCLFARCVVCLTICFNFVRRSLQQLQVRLLFRHVPFESINFFFLLRKLRVSSLFVVFVLYTTEAEFAVPSRVRDRQHVQAESGTSHSIAITIDRSLFVRSIKRYQTWLIRFCSFLFVVWTDIRSVVALSNYSFIAKLTF